MEGSKVPASGPMAYSKVNYAEFLVIDYLVFLQPPEKGAFLCVLLD